MADAVVTGTTDTNTERLNATIRFLRYSLPDREVVKMLDEAAERLRMKEALTATTTP